MSLFQAIATIVIDPVNQKLSSTKLPLLEFSATAILQQSTGWNQTESSDLEIQAYHAPRSFTFENEESFILAMDSGTVAHHRLYLLLFQPHQKQGILSKMSGWQSWGLDASKGAHWYRLSVLRKYTESFEYYLDPEGYACDVALSSTRWMESGVSAIFKSEKTRLGTRKLASCLLDHARCHDDGKEGQLEENGESWMGEATLGRLVVAKSGKAVPSVRQLFQLGMHAF